MSLESILAAIEAAGETEAAHVRAEAESRSRQMLDEAKHKAAARREEARQAALRPAMSERARRLHQAKLEALRTVGEVRNRLVDEALAQTRLRLVALRTDPSYPTILRRLVEEAVHALGAQPALDNHCPDARGDGDEGLPVLESDPRDEALLGRIVDELGFGLPVRLTRNCWGGVVARSGDGRIVVTNTLEARLERATPFLRRDLAAFMKELKDAHV